MTQLIGKSIKAVVATGVLAALSFGANSAFAAVDNGGSGAGNGGLVLVAWDGSHSVMETLNGLGFNSFDGTQSATFSIDLSSLSGFDTTSTSFMVIAPHNTGSGNLGKGLLGTAVSQASIFSGYDTPADALGNAGATNVKADATFSSQMIDQFNLNCSGAAICTGSNGSATDFEDGSLGGGLVDHSGSVSSTLQFFKFLNSSSSANSTTLTQLGSFAFTSLTDLAHATLSYTALGGPSVPLPAAVWLLVSGLAGLGVIGRRKGSATPAVAA